MRHGAEPGRDPAGALVGAALGPLLDWVAANVSFVKEPLDLLLGDPPEIMAYAGSWGQASQRLAQTMAQAVQVAGTIVAVLRELIWGMIKDLVISLVTNAVIAAASAIPSVGASLAAYTAWASAKVSLVMGKIAMGISKVFGKLSKLTAKIGPLSGMFAKAAAAFQKMGARLFVAAGLMPDGKKVPKGPEAAPPPYGPAQNLENPGQKLSNEDYPFLQPRDRTPEVDSVPGDVPPVDRGPMPTGRANPGPAGGAPELDKDAFESFGSQPQLEVWPAGETRYRVVGDGQYANGGFWTKDPPQSMRDIRSGTAVKNEWNGDHGVVAYSPTKDVPVWAGPAGPQPATGFDPVNPRYLPGGTTQYYTHRDFMPDCFDPSRWLIQSAPPWKD